MKFKCKTSGKTYLEVDKGKQIGCSKCAFWIFANSETPRLPAENFITNRHCLAVPCFEHNSYFIEVPSNEEEKK